MPLDTFCVYSYLPAEKSEIDTPFTVMFDKLVFEDTGRVIFKV